MDRAFVTLHIRKETAEILKYHFPTVVEIYNAHIGSIPPGHSVTITVEEFAVCTEFMWIEVSVPWLRSINGSLDVAMQNAWKAIVLNVPGLDAGLEPLIRFSDYTTM